MSDSQQPTLMTSMVRDIYQEDNGSNVVYHFLSIFRSITRIW